MIGLPVPRERYPSDIDNYDWNRIAELIPPEKQRGRHRETDAREIVNAIVYRANAGCVWRMLPHDFPPWATVYTYFRQWREDGTLDAIGKVLKKNLNDSDPQPATTETSQVA